MYIVLVLSNLYMEENQKNMPANWIDWEIEKKSIDQRSNTYYFVM